jgi:16S rRNA (guanine(966)-N(2))-methyltransferase RsmD
MRIIGGRYRSRLLDAPAGLKTRPTSDRLRETLFNVLAPRMEGAAFLDLYAGSGAVGIEALSRGARCVVFVERAMTPLKALRANLARLGIEEGAEVFAGTVSAFLEKTSVSVGVGVGFDVVYVDPPYEAEREYEIALGMLGGTAAGILNKGAVVIAEHRRKDQMGAEFGMLRRTRVLKQGDAALSFYAAAS